MKILLNENNSVLSNNKELNINFDIDSKNKPLPSESLVDNLSLFEQYNKERDECNKYRLIFNIDSICNNILFNVKTEVVIHEGSDSCSCLNFAGNGWSKSEVAKNAINTTSPITIEQALRDTEYSHEENGGFIYHCGVDIFNNHMLRKHKFIHVNPVTGATGKQNYNTISDFLRNYDGSVVKDKLKVSLGNETWKNRHLYFSDSLDDLKHAFFEKAQEQNGWWGFVNPSMINLNTSSSSTIDVNEMLSNKSACEFIDFYPDRTLFSFVPKYNKYRKRIEKNWECCITYPYKKDVELLQAICGGENDAIKAVFKIVTNANGVKLLQCSSYFKHNLKNGDNINVYYYTDKDDGVNVISPIVPPDTSIPEHYKGGAMVYEAQEEELNLRAGNSDTGTTETTYSYQIFDEEIRVYSTGDLNGDYKDRIFSIRYENVESIIEDLTRGGFFYKKISNESECSYYVRKFKKVKKDGNETLNSGLKYDINKVGFGNNVYGDDVAQLIFTDDLDVTNLRDENGLELHEVYLTLIKNNKGYKSWYQNPNHDTGDDSIEYSHCFGKLTSGIDFAGVDIAEQPFDYNVRYLHNLNLKDYTHTSSSNGGVNREILNTFESWSGTIMQGVPKVIEDDLTIENDEFYGDIVEFDSYLYKTTVIGRIYHRFNTAQREYFDLSSNYAFRDMYQDIIVSDDYDAANTIGGLSSFQVKKYHMNSVYDIFALEEDAGSGKTLVYSNIMPEGYFYNPHNKIKLREETETKHSQAKAINYSWFSIKGNYVISTYQIIDGREILIERKYIDDDILDITGGANYIEKTSLQEINEILQDEEEEIILRSSVAQNEGGSEVSANVIEHTAIPPTASTYSVTEFNGFTLKVKVPANFGFVKGDTICVYDKETEETIWGTIKSFKDMIISIIFNKESFPEEVLTKTYYFKPRHLDRRYYVFWSENSVPLHAKLCLEKQEFSWRDLQKQSELYRKSDLYNLPFSNGRLYIEKNINFFLRRQDPWGYYKLSKPTNYGMPNPMSQFIIPGSKEVDLSRFETMINDDINECW